MCVCDMSAAFQVVGGIVPVRWEIYSRNHMVLGGRLAVPAIMLYALLSLDGLQSDD